MKPTQTSDRWNDSSIKKAPISAFQFVRTEILQGNSLEEVKRIERSIIQYGLIRPIVTSRLRNVLLVIDGKKRLQALKRLEFKGELPDQLSEIPHISVLESQKTDYPADSILSRQHLYTSVMALKMRGISVDTIAQYLCLCRDTIADVVLLSRLSEPVRKAYFEKAFSFSIARTYASIPVSTEQTALMLRLGTSANETTILDAIDEISDIKAYESAIPLGLIATKKPSENLTIALA